MSDRKARPSALADVLARVLEQSGLQERVEQAAVVPEWPGLVGPTIAAVTEPSSVSADGTLFVAVTTNAWMTELSLMEPELLRHLNAGERRTRIRKIRWYLKR